MIGDLTFGFSGEKDGDPIVILLFGFGAEKEEEKEELNGPGRGEGGEPEAKETVAPRGFFEGEEDRDGDWHLVKGC